MLSGDIVEHDLVKRIAGHAVMEELLRSRADTPPRGTLARVLGISPLTRNEQAWYVGAIGESITGRMLASLDNRWTVLHAVPIGTGSSDVDHIIIGPGGVFTVNTKHYAGQLIWVGSRALMVSGHSKPYMRNSEYEAERATISLSRVLPASVDVTPVLAFVSPKSITIKEQPRFVKILEAHSLVRWLHKQPVVLAPHQVALIAMVAADPTTWHTHPSASTNARALQQQFEALHREVRTAKRLRLSWAAFVVLAAAIAALVSTPAISQFLSNLFI